MLDHLGRLDSHMDDVDREFAQQLRYLRGIIISPRAQYDAVLMKKNFDRLTETKIFRAVSESSTGVSRFEQVTGASRYL